MIDMLTVLVFFLLVYSSQEIEILPPPRTSNCPSRWPSRTRATLSSSSSRKRNPHDGESLGQISDILASQELIIPALKTALENQVQRVLNDEPGEQTEEERIASREVTIMADKEIPYQLLKRVMATSTAADYGQLSLAVLQKASEARLATVARN